MFVVIGMLLCKQTVSLPFCFKCIALMVFAVPYATLEMTCCRWKNSINVLMTLSLKTLMECQQCLNCTLCKRNRYVIKYICWSLNVDLASFSILMVFRNSFVYGVKCAKCVYMCIYIFDRHHCIKSGNIPKN